MNRRHDEGNSEIACIRFRQKWRGAEAMADPQRRRRRRVQART